MNKSFFDVVRIKKNLKLEKWSDYDLVVAAQKDMDAYSFGAILS